jgi:hypothetical protein
MTIGPSDALPGRLAVDLLFDKREDQDTVRRPYTKTIAPWAWIMHRKHIWAVDCAGLTALQPPKQAT